MEYLDVPLKISVFLEAVGKTRWNIWPPPYNLSGGYITARSNIISALQGFEHNITGEVFISRPESGSVDGWIFSRTGLEGFGASTISSEGYESRVAMGIKLGKNPIQYIFVDTPGNYTYGIELTFLDTEYVNKTVGATIYIDDFDLFLWGDAQGLLGLDQEGRDIFAQVVYGTRISLYLGIAVSVMTIGLGLIVGLAAGYIGSFVDQGLMRFNDLMLCLPTLPLLIVLAAVVGTTIENLMIILVLLGWNGFARVVRSLTLSLKERPFVEAAKAVGAGTGYTLLKHILPNVMSVVYVSLATSVPGAVTAEASLSWLGFYDNTRMSWGRILYNATAEGGTALAIVNPMWIIVPGLMISALAVSFILLGYALDEILNPKLRMRM
jgi:ABC-type dipeptide/oligopeptide/nickel transport system permease subunit